MHGGHEALVEIVRGGGTGLGRGLVGVAIVDDREMRALVGVGKPHLQTLLEGVGFADGRFGLDHEAAAVFGKQRGERARAGSGLPHVWLRQRARHAVAIAMINPPSCLAAWPDGVPFQDTNLLVKFIIVPLDSEPAQFYITGPVADNPARLPIYLDLPIDGTQEIPMVPYPSGEAMASFTVNPVALAVASATWGEVKALYR